MSPGLHLAVAQAVVERGLWAAGERVAVAVSGGRDSVVLLDLLHRTRGVHGAELSVATFDHGTRAEGGEDAAWVQARGQDLGLVVHRGAATLGPHASEAACRQARYAFLDALDVDAVALAHHARDQAETALLGLLRGGGTRALAGMAWRRGRYVRPLLDTGADEVAAWAVHAGLAWREDPSNASPRFLRNRVRHELLPLIEDLRPGAVDALARGAGHAAADVELLERLAGAAVERAGEGWSRAWLAQGPAPLTRRALQAELPDASSRHLDAILAAARRGRGMVRVSRRVTVVVDADAVRIVEADVPGQGAACAPESG